MKKKWFNITFFVAVFILTVAAIVSNADLQQMSFYIRQADIRYLLLSVLCVILYILGESVVIKYLLATTNAPASFGHCCLFSFIGFFIAASHHLHRAVNPCKSPQ